MAMTTTHRALQIPEILLNIFDHLCPSRTYRETSDLLALARTCHAFKGPALDVLWEELVDSSPLARCLPEASRLSSSEDGCYSFSRPLTQVEWGILQSYTRRVRSILDCNRGLDWESVAAFLNLPSTEPLFPKLHRLSYYPATETMQSLQIRFPSLVSLHLADTECPNVSRDHLESFSKFSPNIRELFFVWYQPNIGLDAFFLSCICRWRNLQIVRFPDTALGMDALTHLSRIVTLTELDFTVSTALLDQITSTSLLLFSSNLGDLTLHSESLDTISRLLSQTQLPPITDFCVYIESYPFKMDFSLFLAGVQASIGHTIQELELYHGLPRGEYVAQDTKEILSWEDLLPCMAFHDLCSLRLDIDWLVELTGDELLALSSAWPDLEELIINDDWGWRSCGISPDSLVRLLQKCPSLARIALAIDTEDQFPPSSPPLGLTLQPRFSIDVVDSDLEPKAIPAVAAFFAAIMPHPNFSFRAWDGLFTWGEPSEYRDHWYEAYKQANALIEQRLGD